MHPKPVSLIDPTAGPVASLDVATVADRYHGRVTLDDTPPALRALFVEFEEAVEGQLFPLADEVEGRIAASGLRARFDDGSVADVSDLQVHPSTGRVSFRLAPAHFLEKSHDSRATRG